MPEVLEAVFTFASEEIFPGFLSPMRLNVNDGAVDVSRVTAPSGLSYLADHDQSRPLGRVLRTAFRGGLGYAEAVLPSVQRSAPYVEELRAGLRSAISPSFYLREVEFVEIDGEIVEHVTKWTLFECSSVTTPRLKEIGLISLQEAGDKASLTDPNRVPRGISTRPVAPMKAVVPAARPISTPTPSSQERNARMTQIETRVDEKLVDLSRRERMLADVESLPATGAPLALDKTLLSLNSLASNPSANTPRMPGVEVLTAVRNHVVARVPTMALALTSADIPGSEIETTAPVLTQPQGRGSARLLSRFRPSSPPFGSERFPVLDTAPVSGMRNEGQAALSIVDPTFRSPALEVRPHLAQVRQSFSQQLLVQTGGAFRDAVDESLRLALMALMARQAVVGDAVAPNLRGLANVAGIGTSTYAMTDRGGAATFRDAEDVLEDATYGEQLRPTWLLSGELYQLAKRTVREPGDGRSVLEREVVLDGYEALKIDAFPDDQAILVDLGYQTFAIWQSLDVVVNAVTSPGNVLITINSWCDLASLRPTAIVLVDQA